MNHGSLFSGIGGFDLAAQWMDWNNAFHCEIDPWNQKLLHQHFPNSVQYGDITTTDFTIWRGRIDVLTGGFPCQDASRAKTTGGQGQKGLEGARTGLYWHMLRAVKEIRPRFIVAENVSDLIKINGGWDFYRITKSLYEIGYDAEWDCFTASMFGAPHHRERVYLVAYPIGLGLQTGKHILSRVVQENAQGHRRIAGATVQIGGGVE
jgi:DNA (cytosine-5)-methyltransferase 1